MENEKRPLKLYEKVMAGFGFLLILLAVATFILEFCGIINFGIVLGWMCLSLSNVLQNCLRWENHTRMNIVFVWLWSGMSVLNAIMLVLRLVL